MLPTEIGYAAAYEAYRIYIHHNARLYESLYSRPERQREALVATAVAEGSSIPNRGNNLRTFRSHDVNLSVQRLWQDTGRAYDEFGLRTAAEAAAASAALIFRNHLEYDANDPYGTPGGGGYRRTRHNSIAPSTASSPYSSSYSLDPYALDDSTLRRSRYGYRDGINRSPYLGGVGGVGAGAVGAGGVGSGAGAGALNTYNSTASMPVPMPSSSPYPGHTSYPASYAQGSIVLPPASNSYGGAPSTSYSTGYPQGPAALPVSQGYPSSYSSGGSYGGMGQQQAPVVVIPQTGHHHHHHRHRSLGIGHRHRRHRSLERYY